MPAASGDLGRGRDHGGRGVLVGNDDVRPRGVGMLRRALAALPARVLPDPEEDRRPRVRADAGYFTAELAEAAVGAGADLRHHRRAEHRDVAGVRRHRRGAVGDGAEHARRQVAAYGYAPAGRRIPTRSAPGPRGRRGDLRRPAVAAPAHYARRTASAGPRRAGHPRLRGQLHRHQHPHQRLCWLRRCR